MKHTSQTIEEKITKLEVQVAWFESDEFVLEEATTRYAAASQLADEITQDITELKNTITVVTSESV
jgi:exonuclease VII small subunit